MNKSKIEVPINGCFWSIEEAHGQSPCFDDVLYFGKTFYVDKKIYINANLSKEQKYKTLCHELAHAFIAEYLLDPQERNRKFNEEEMCDFIGHYAKQIVTLADKFYPKAGV
ncbi:MAG: ImmA/IrrE family metallo-endopeptidase [Clostridia bacterium]|nr:ImmA/IrrE family metallo-endopeptidase [Clostridia bacterium]